jgi:hypothetical protein
MSQRASLGPAALLLLAAMSATADDWPQFRGPDGQGHSTAQNLPIRWSEKENIAWKQPIPGLGWSSPVIQAGKIWLTTAVDEGRSLRALCLDAVTGRTIHDVEVFPSNEPLPIHGKNSHASPTPIMQDDRIYVHFGTYGTACITSAGQIVWTQQLRYHHGHGPGGSPILFEDLLIVNCDGTDVQFVVGLDKASGKERWKTVRAHISEPRRSGAESPGMGFSTPLLITDGDQPLVISTGGDHVAAYDARTGEERWWSAYDGYSLVPRPVVGHGMAYICSGYNAPAVYAIKLGGRGDVSRTHVAWQLTRGAPHNPSPLLVGDEIYLVSDRGVATCVDATTGAIHWQERVSGNFSASPLYAEGRIYLLDENGTTTVISAGQRFQRLATNVVPGRTLASLSTTNGAMFLRTDTHLYRISSEGN